MDPKKDKRKVLQHLGVKRELEVKLGVVKFVRVRRTVWKKCSIFYLNYK